MAASSEARFKLERATAHLADMRAAMDTWATRAAPGVRAEIGDDRLTVRYLVATKETPPLRTWALILGDGLHNARAALDALVWGYCDHSSLTADQQRRIQWPMVEDPTKWAAVASRQLHGLDAHVVDAIRVCQPFNLPAVGSPSALKLLHDLDIVDKHRLTLNARVRLAQAGHSATVKFQSEDAAARFEEGEHEYNGNVTLEDGSIIGTQRFLDRVESVSGALDLAFQLQIEHEAGIWPPTDLLAMLIDAVRQTIDAIDQIACDGNS